MASNLVKAIRIEQHGGPEVLKLVEVEVPPPAANEVTIEQHAAATGHGVVRDFVGHGIGRRMHEDPSVPNYGKPGTGRKLKPGMTIAIEPMFTLGHGAVRVLDDYWTVVTADGSLAAHLEHTVAITDRGVEILAA